MMHTSTPGTIRELVDRETGIMDRKVGPWTVTGGLAPADGLIFHTLGRARLYIHNMDDGRSDWERRTWDEFPSDESYSRGNQDDWWSIRPFSPEQFLTSDQMNAFREEATRWRSILPPSP